MSLILKVIMLVFYIAAAASPFVGFLAPYSKAMLIFAAVLLAVHVLEYLAVRNKISGANNFVPILLFGIVHWKSLLKEP